MTLETRHIIDLSDLESLSLQCVNCQTRVTWAIQGRGKLLLDCPGCQQPICPDPSDIRAAVLALLQGVQRARHALSQPGCPVTLQVNLTPTTTPLKVG